MFKIMIPTRGRAKTQLTFQHLPTDLKANTMLVAPLADVPALERVVGDSGAQVIAQPGDITTIADKRAWMIAHADFLQIEKILMLDDDLFFYSRYWNPTARFWKHTEAVGDWRLNDAAPAEITHWITELMNRVDDVTPHGGFGPRQGNDKTDGGWLHGANRMMLALAYHVPTVRANAEFGRIRFREDMDVALQLLRKGFPNVLTNDFVVGQKSFAAPGGCSEERTIEKSNEDAHRLQELHPGLVRVVERKYKDHPRQEVVVSWQKALRSSGHPKPLGVPRDARDSEGRPISGNRD